jgi:chloramphenicol-sensitive protein RarD
VAKGVFLSVFSSCIFGGIFYLVTLLSQLSGQEIMGWRVLCMFSLLTGFMLAHKNDWQLVREITARLASQPWRIPAMLLSSALIGSQFWIFVWAPNHGHALDLSLGYFLLPLAMVLCGRIVYKEKLSRFQRGAVLFAFIGICNQFYIGASFSWVVLLSALGYPPYFMLRRYLKHDNLGGFWFDLLFMLPAGLFLIWDGEHSVAFMLSEGGLFWMLLLYGFSSGVAIIFYILSSRLLTLGLLGLLGYVEPVLLVIIALLLGNSIAQGELITYIGVWLAVLMLVFDGVRVMRLHRKFTE